MKKLLLNKQRGESSTVMAIMVLVIFIIVVGVGIAQVVRAYSRDHTESELIARVLSTEIKGIGSGDDRKDHYLISVQPVNKVDGVYESVGAPETIEVADSFIHKQYTSADKYFELQNNIGAVYHFNLQGWRNGYYSEFRNIYAMKKLQDKGR